MFFVYFFNNLPMAILTNRLFQLSYYMYNHFPFINQPHASIVENKQGKKKCDSTSIKSEVELLLLLHTQWQVIIIITLYIESYFVFACFEECFFLLLFLFFKLMKRFFCISHHTHVAKFSFVSTPIKSPVFMCLPVSSLLFDDHMRISFVHLN